MAMNYNTFKNSLLYIRLSDLTADHVKEHVFMQIVNTEANKTLLENCPHREFLDLSVIYRIHFPELCRDYLASAIINNDLAKNLSLSEEALYESAIVNTKKILEPVIIPLSGIPMVREELQRGNPSGTELLWAVISRNVSYGATLIIYPDILEKLGEMIGSNYYLLPSSIHEFLATPDMGEIGGEIGVVESLADMVNSVNHTSVDAEERLSNQIYYYDRDKKELSRITDREADLGIDDVEEERG